MNIPSGLNVIECEPRIGSNIAEGYLITKISNKLPPFIVQTLSVNALDKSLPFYICDLYDDATNMVAVVEGTTTENIEPRVPYLHTFPPIASGELTSVRSTNILVTHEFLNNIPLFYTAVVKDVNRNPVLTDTIDFIQVYYNGDPYGNCKFYKNEEDTVSVYIDKRGPGFTVTLNGTNYPLEIIPAMRYDEALTTVNDWFMSATGVATFKQTIPIDKIAIGYGEYYDSELEGFPKIAVATEERFGRWQVGILSGSLGIKQSGGEVGVFNLGHQTAFAGLLEMTCIEVPKKILYGVKAEKIDNNTYGIGFGIRSFLSARTSPESTTTITPEYIDYHRGIVRFESSIVVKNIWCDVTIVDYWFLDSRELKPSTISHTYSLDSSIFTNGTSDLDYVFSVFARSSKFISLNAGGGLQAYAPPRAMGQTIAKTNGFNNHLGLDGAVFDATNYNLIGEIHFPQPLLEMSPLVFNGISGTNYSINGSDLTDNLVNGIVFKEENSLDIEGASPVKVIKVTIPTALFSIASRDEIQKEFGKFLPLGTIMKIEEEH